MSLFGFLLVPVIIGLVAFIGFKHKVTLKEFLCLEGICIIAIILFYLLANYMSGRDTKYVHGKITNKVHDTMTCCHTYQTCHKVGKTSVCITHHLHAHDYYWSVLTTLGEEITIKSCESDSNSVPEKWVKANVGDHVTASRSFQNPLLKDENSILSSYVEQTKLNKIPNFPDVFDYYERKGVIGIDVVLSPMWDRKIKQVNSDIPKGADVVLVMIGSPDVSFGKAVEAKWIKGKENNVVIVVGVVDNTIKWVYTFSATQSEQLKSEINFNLQGLTVEDYDKAGMIIEKTMNQYYKDTSMEKYDYLSFDSGLKTGWIIAGYIFITLLSILLVYLAAVYDWFGEENNFSNWRRYR